MPRNYPLDIAVVPEKYERVGLGERPRDLLLTKKEQAAMDRMPICVSTQLSPSRAGPVTPPTRPAADRAARPRT